jgi:hypothetical protein
VSSERDQLTLVVLNTDAPLRRTGQKPAALEAATSSHLACIPLDDAGGAVVRQALARYPSTTGAEPGPGTDLRCGQPRLDRLPALRRSGAASAVRGVGRLRSGRQLMPTCQSNFRFRCYRTPVIAVACGRRSPGFLGR